MTSAQGDRQASVRAVTGTAYDYNGDWLALFDAVGIAAGDFDGRMLAWINQVLAASYTDVNAAMSAYAATQGALTWQGMGTFSPVPAWVLAGANHDFDPVNDRYYLNGASYSSIASYMAATGSTNTRNSSALWWDSLGNVSSFGNNVARRSDLGLVLEESRTNLVTTYNNLTAAGWGQFTTGTGTVSRTAASGTAPDGTNTATLVSINRSAATDQAQVNFSFTGTVAAYSQGVWLKAATGPDVGKQVSINLYNGVGGFNILLVTLTANWVWYKNENKTLAANSSCQFQVGYLPTANGGGSQTGAVGVLVWGCQAELGQGATTTIPTAGASATRVADVWQFGSSIVTLAASAQVSMYLAGTYNRASVNKDNIPLSGTFGGGSINPIYLRYADLKASNWNGTADLATANAATAGAALKAAVKGSAAGRSICLNGGTIATDANPFGTPSDFYLGSDRGTNYWWNGPITRLAMWNSLIADAFMQGQTT